MAGEPISQLTQIAAPPYAAGFTSPTTGAMLEILDTTNTSMAAAGTNSRIAPGDLLKGYLAAGANITLTETSGVITIAGTGGGGGSPGGSSGQIQYDNAGSFGGFTMSGDATLATSTGVITISAGAVTLAKHANLAASSLMGNPTGSSAAPSAITLAGGLAFAGATLTAATLAPLASPTFSGVVNVGVGLTGLVKATAGVLSGATSGADYLTPGGSGAALTGITGAQVSGNIAGSAGGLTANITESQVTGLVADLAGKQPAGAYLTAPITESQVTGLVTDLAAKAPLASPTFTGVVTLPVGLTGLVKAAAGVVSAASAGTDYLAPAGSGAALTGLTGGQITGNIAGSAGGLTATLGLAGGGTGQTSAAAAFNALSPMTTLGDIAYESAANTASRLAGNTTATKNFLAQTGNGSISAAPAWGTIAAGDLPTVPVTKGGTNLATLTAHAVMLGEGASALGFATIGTAGQVLTDNGAGVDPTFTATPLSTSVSTKLSSRYTLTTSNANVTGLAVTLPTAGTYLLSGMLQTVLLFTPSSAGGDGHVEFTLLDSTNSVTIANCTILYATGPVSGIAINNQLVCAFGPYMYTVAAGATIQVKGLYALTNSTLILAYFDTNSVLTAIRIK